MKSVYPDLPEEQLPAYPSLNQEAQALIPQAAYPTLDNPPSSDPRRDNKRDALLAESRDLRKRLDTLLKDNQSFRPQGPVAY